MSDSRMGDIIKASLDGIRDFTSVDTVIGNAINTAAGVTVIPVSKISVGIANGGFDNGKKLGQQSFGGGGGTGISVRPIAFLTVNKDGVVDLIKIDTEATTADKALEVINRAPDIIEKIKNSLS